MKSLMKFQYYLASFIENSLFWVSMLQTLELALRPRLHIKLNLLNCNFLL